MEEQKTNTSESNEEISNSVDFIKKYNELKKNTVSKEDYEQLVNERNELVNSIVNGLDTPQETPKDYDVNELRSELFDENNSLSNLDYATKAIQLREQVLRDSKGKKDIFVPKGKMIAPTDSDVQTAQRVADVLTECIEQSNGDSTLFTGLLNQRIVEVRPMTPRR